MYRIDHKSTKGTLQTIEAWLNKGKNEELCGDMYIQSNGCADGKPCVLPKGHRGMHRDDKKQPWFNGPPSSHTIIDEAEGTITPDQFVEQVRELKSKVIGKVKVNIITESKVEL